jgi:hypothetical protein
MGTIELPPDLLEFLRLLNSHGAEYLLVGGYAVGIYGYPRATGDMDVWVGRTPENATRLVQVFIAFGYSPTSVNSEMFLDAGRIIRMGVPPVCIDVLMSASGANFAECYARRRQELLNDTAVSVISLADLKVNKQASGRPKDLEDLRHLE